MNRPRGRPLVIAHRGASGYRPEHTLEAYQLALDLGADFIEPDLVATRDGMLICRHENALALLTPDGEIDTEMTSTDVHLHPGFADRLTTKIIDGRPLRGWFSEDFTLAEIRQLRAIERLPALRPDNTRWDRRCPIPTFAEVITLVAAHAARTGVRAGIYPETKHPSWFLDEGHRLDGSRIGLCLGECVVEVLLAHGFTAPDEVFIQSFETGNLRDLATRILPAAGLELPLIQLMHATEPPWDTVRTGQPLRWSTGVDWEAVATYAAGVGPDRRLLTPRGAIEACLARPCALIEDAHAAGLDVHAWTFRAENRFLSPAMQDGEDPAHPGNLAGEIASFAALGIDGLFTDHCDLVLAALDARRRPDPSVQM